MGSLDRSSDPYVDPQTGVLHNLVGATTPADLHRAEADLTAVRTIQLRDAGFVPPTRDAAEVRALHRHVFQDLFTWAGDYRTIDMSKDGGEFFVPCSLLGRALDNVMVQLAERRWLQGLSRPAFIAALAEFYDDLNSIHPFREGNGRTQRLYWSRVAFDAGWILDWRPVTGPTLNDVSRRAREDRDLDPLQAALHRCVRPR